MPVFESLVSRLSEKLEEVRISDVNHELGKVKESILSDLNGIGKNLIRSESAYRFGGLFFNSVPPNKISKSASLPSFPPDKYKYRSGETIHEEEEEVAEDLAPLDEDIVSKFIQVVESPSPRVKKKKPPSNSREEIRKKLAFSSEERPNGYKRGFIHQNNKDLEVCFINKTLSDEYNNDEAEDHHPDVYLNPNKDNEEDLSSEEDSDVFPVSKSDWDNLRNPDLSLPPSPSKGPTYREEKRKADFNKRISRLRKEARADLENCKRIARRKILAEKQKRSSENPLRKLGIKEESLKSLEGLSGLNIATLLVIINDSHSKIEAFNEELVKLLLEKDELYIEQEGQLLDIEDLTLKIQGA